MKCSFSIHFVKSYRCVSVFLSVHLDLPMVSSQLVCHFIHPFISQSINQSPSICYMFGIFILDKLSISPHVYRTCQLWFDNNSTNQFAKKSVC